MVLVTGGSGFIGGHLLRALAESGDRVRAFLRRKMTLPSGVEAAYGDLSTGEGIADAVRGADVVIHSAGAIKALKPDGYYASNTRATERLVQALGGSNARLVLVSSLAAAGPSIDGKPVNEDMEPHPVSHYGKSKLEAERIVRSLRPDAVVVRPPVVYGPGDTGVFTLLRSLSRGLALKIGHEDRWFSMIYVRDLVKGLMLAAHHPLAAGRTYFMAHPEPVSWDGFAVAAGRTLHIKPISVAVPMSAATAIGYCAEIWSRITGKAGMVSREKIAEAAYPFWTCDPRRAADELGFKATTGLDAGLSETIAWYKDAGWLKR